MEKNMEMEIEMDIEIKNKILKLIKKFNELCNNEKDKIKQWNRIVFFKIKYHTIFELQVPDIKHNYDYNIKSLLNNKDLYFSNLYNIINIFKMLHNQLQGLIQIIYKFDQELTHNSSYYISKKSFPKENKNIFLMNKTINRINRLI